VVTSTNPLHFIMDQTRTVTATFTTRMFALAMHAQGNGSVDVEPPADNGMVAGGTVITLTATPGADSDFIGWSGDLIDTRSPITFTMDGNKTITATFALQCCTLGIGYAGDGTGSVGVAASEPGPRYSAGTVVTLTALPDIFSDFVGWSGAVSDTNKTVAVTMDANKIVTATFELKTYALDVRKTGGGAGSVLATPSGPAIAAGRVVTLTAIPDTGSVFAGWSGGVSGRNNPITFTMQANTIVTATLFSLSELPTAEAGTDQTVRSASTVRLDGSGSTDPQGHLPLTYGWTQTGGPTVTLSGADGSQPSFTAPTLPTGTQSLAFTLVVTDSVGIWSMPDETRITVTPSTLYLPLTQD
jgi:hypothetical protein